MLRAFQSASAAERLARARQFVDSIPDSEVAIVGSSRAAADDFVRKLANKRVAVLGLHRFSMVQFAVRSARLELARHGLAPLTADGAAALAVRCVFSVRANPGLKFFGPVADKPGFAAALAGTISEVRASGVKPPDLVQLGDRGKDLAALLAEYEAQLHSGRLADITDVFNLATEQVSSGSAAKWSHPILLLDVPIASLAERRFLKALASKQLEIFATVVEGDTRTTAAMRELAHEWDCGTLEGDTSLDRLQNFVFSSTPGSSYPEDEMVQFFSAPGEGRECVEIARRIQEAARTGTAFDRVAVALRSPQTYSPLLEEAFERAGIPVYFARGTRRPDASGRALIALLLCAEERLSAKRFAEYLSLAQVPDLTEQSGPPAARDLWTAPSDDMLTDTQAPAERPVSEPPPEEAGEHEPLVGGTLRAPWRWEELLVEAAVIGGKDRWERRLKGLAAEVDGKIEALKVEEPDSPQIDRFERQRADLDHLQRFAIPVLEILNSLPKEATWGEWLSLLRRMATRVLRRPEHVLGMLAELQPLATVGPIPLCEVREALSPRLTELAVEPPKSRYGRVFVGTPEHLRGLSFSVVFVPGLAERIFPQKIREDPLLLDGDRQQLAAADQSLVTLADRASNERLRLRMIAGVAEENLFFSYPRVEVALARPRVPSFYALDIRRTTLGSLPNVEEFERESARNSGAELAWLAPEFPSAAIDDIEHDLSVLRPLLMADPKTVRGGARYLMELSPELGRSLRTRWQRWHKQWTAVDGIFEPSQLTRRQLERYRLSQRAWSPTSLQLFAACPYRFLLSAVHRLSPREASVPLELLDPLTKGRMYHSVLARFLRSALERKMLPVSLASLSNAQTLMDQIVTDTAAGYHEQLAPAIERVWQDGIETLRADLRGWLTQIAERQDGYLPELIEFAFGLPVEEGRDVASTPQAAMLTGGFQIHGVIDLVERNAAGDWRITDHKTGKNRVPDGMVVDGGEVLQPALYSLSIEALRSIFVKEANLSFCTAAGAYSQHAVVMDELTRHSAHQVLRTIETAIEEGFLPAAPREEGCKWCDFVPICGPHEQVRVGRKDPTPLDDLVRLRNMR